MNCRGENGSRKTIIKRYCSGPSYCWWWLSLCFRHHAKCSVWKYSVFRTIILGSMETSGNWSILEFLLWQFLLWHCSANYSFRSLPLSGRTPMILRASGGANYFKHHLKMKHRELQWGLGLDSVMAHVLTADSGKWLVRNRKEYEELVQSNSLPFHVRWYSIWNTWLVN